MSDNWLANEVATESKKLSKRSHKIRIITYVIGASLVSVVIILISNIKPATSVAAKIIGGSPTSILATPSPSASSNTATQLLQQEEQESEAEAAQEEKMAQDDLNAITPTQSFTIPAFSISTAAGAISVPSYSYTPPTISTPDCSAYGSAYAPLAQKLTQEEGAYNSFVGEVNTPGGINLPGVSGAGVQAYEFKQEQMDIDQINGTEQQINALHQQYPNC